MLSDVKNNKSLTFYQQVNPSFHLDQSSAGEIGTLSSSLSAVSFATSQYTNSVNQAFTQLRESIITRGMAWPNNTVATRGGFMAENWHADSYNLDAAIKQVNTPKASVPSSNANASADIIYGDEAASLKYYSDATGSAKSQLNPEYGNQHRIVPSDQKADAQAHIDDIATRNMQKGRTDVAAEQQKVKDLIDDRIRGPEGVESTPLSKEQDMELGKAIKKDENGNTYVDNTKIDKVMDDTGVTPKVKKAIKKNELSGLGLAVAIGAGVGLTLSFITSLAQSGISPDSIKLAAIEGVKGGLESGLLSAASYGIGRTIGEVATQAMSGFLENTGISITENISKMLNAGVVGVMTISLFSAYQFTKLKLQGIGTKDALIQTGKQALFSLSLLAVSIAAQGIWGGAAGIIVSLSIGVIMISYSVTDSVHQRHFSDKIRVYTIESCYPKFST